MRLKSKIPVQKTTQALNMSWKRIATVRVSPGLSVSINYSCALDKLCTWVNGQGRGMVVSAADLEPLHSVLSDKSTKALLFPTRNEKTLGYFRNKNGSVLLRLTLGDKENVGIVIAKEDVQKFADVLKDVYDFVQLVKNKLDGVAYRHVLTDAIAYAMERNTEESAVTATNEFKQLQGLLNALLMTKNGDDINGPLYSDAQIQQKLLRKDNIVAESVMRRLINVHITKT